MRHWTDLEKQWKRNGINSTKDANLIETLSDKDIIAACKSELSLQPVYI